MDETNEVIEVNGVNESTDRFHRESCLDEATWKSICSRVYKRTEKSGKECPDLQSITLSSKVNEIDLKQVNLHSTIVDINEELSDSDIPKSMYENSAGIKRKHESDDTQEEILKKKRRERDTLVYELFKKQAEIEEITNKDRYSIFPIKDELAHGFYIDQCICRWNNHKSNFSRDVEDYKKRLNPRFADAFNIMISFFLLADGMISIGLFRFLMECETFEETLYFTEQASMEAIHAEFYSMSARAFYVTAEAQQAAINKAKTSKSIISMESFITKWIHSDKPRWQRLVAASAAEGIFFFNKFIFILYLNTLGLFPNFSFLTGLTWRDENIHRNANAAFAKDYREFDPVIASEIIEEAHQIELISIDEMYSEPIDELTAENVKLATMNIVDDLRHEYGMEPLYDVRQPFEWLEKIISDIKVNFFERRSSQYSMASKSDLLDIDTRCGITKRMSPLSYLNLI
jgi:ribonucleotide reductase beta subunit family protein with ferritin-like domain